MITKRGKLQLLEPYEMRELSDLPTIGVPEHYLRGWPSTDEKRLAL